MLVNYWDATIGVLPLNTDGTFAAAELTFRYDPKENPGKMHVSADQHVNHSINDQSAQKERQLDPHSHAVVLEPYCGAVAYVPRAVFMTRAEVSANFERLVLGCIEAIFCKQILILESANPHFENTFLQSAHPAPLRLSQLRHGWLACVEAVLHQLLYLVQNH